jgi:hypothetical protein
MTGRKSLSEPPKHAGNGKRTTKRTSVPGVDDPYAVGHDVLLVNGTIDEQLFSQIVQAVTRQKSNDKVVVGLVTYGGQANHAYRIGRYLQSIYQTVVVFIPSLCKSAGTLVAAAANRLVMSPFGEIGPLDVQLLQRDELFGRRSGLTTRSALADLKGHSFDLFENFMLGIIRRSGGAVSFRLAADLSARATSELMSGVYSQINPDTLGQDFRDLSVATEYCKRLNDAARNLKVGAIRRLVNDYPSHDFVIDLQEAKTLFEHVDLPTVSLYRLLTAKITVLGTPKTGAPLVEMVGASVGEKVVRDETVPSENSDRDDSTGGQRRDGGGAAATSR